MARGWESKAVESQMDSAEAKKSPSRSRERTPEEIQRQREREGLELSRKRILRDLESAANPRHRATLEAALRYLDEKLAALNG